jgi:hypothetical protein
LKSIDTYKRSIRFQESNILSSDKQWFFEIHWKSLSWITLLWYLLAELGTHNHAWSFGAFGTYSIAPCIITCIHHLSSLSSIETHWFSLSFKTALVKFVPKVWLSRQSSNITFPALKVVKPTHKSRETDGHGTTPQAFDSQYVMTMYLLFMSLFAALCYCSC